MHWLGKTTLCVVFELLGFAIQFANLFIGDIVNFEITNGTRFNYHALLHNSTFWFVLVVQIAYFFLSWYVRTTNRKTDEAVENALRDGKINLVAQVVDYSKNHDFVAANKALRLFNRMNRKGR